MGKAKTKAELVKVASPSQRFDVGGKLKRWLKFGASLLGNASRELATRDADTRGADDQAASILAWIQLGLLAIVNGSELPSANFQPGIVVSISGRWFSWFALFDPVLDFAVDELAGRDADDVGIDDQAARFLFYVREILNAILFQQAIPVNTEFVNAVNFDQTR